MYKSRLINLFFLVVFVILTSCTQTIVVNVPLYEYPPDWKDSTVRARTISEYSSYLKGKKIFLDPGHGGEDRKNKSRSGKIVEADVNLRVALSLKKYLEQAGAVVFITREEDKTVPLGRRSELANESGAEIFLSIHHNAPGKAEDDYSDYTSVYYHANEQDYDYEPCNHDIARYIERDLSYVMHNPGGLGSFDGTYSDYNIYPGEGFSVLRRSNIPAVLVECAFHTSRFEEFRLNDDQFNRIQAWGIFRGLAKYLRADKPEIILISDSLKLSGRALNFAFLLKDTSGIDSKSIGVYFNKTSQPAGYNGRNNLVSVRIDSVSAGSYPLKITAANKNGVYSLPFHKRITLTDSLGVTLSD
jgi:N-acetylmuramoyl-L-alanine amidase